MPDAAAFTPPPDRRLFGMALRLGAIALLSTMLMLIKLAGEAGVSLPEILFWRQGLAVPVILVPVLLGPGLGSLRTNRAGRHLTRSALGLAGMVLNFGTILLLPLAEATTIGFTVPLFATLFSAIILKERVGIHRWSAVLLGFAGILIVVQPSGHMRLAGASTGLAAAVLIALVSLQIRELTRTEPSTRIVFWFSLLSTIPLAILLPWYGTSHDDRVWALLAGIGVTGGIGQILLTSALRYAPVSTVIGMDYSSLVSATLFGWLLWGHIPSARTWLGAPLIIASGLYIAWREHRLAIKRSGEVSV